MCRDSTMRWAAVASATIAEGCASSRGAGDLRTGADEIGREFKQQGIDVVLRSIRYRQRIRTKVENLSITTELSGALLTFPVSKSRSKLRAGLVFHPRWTTSGRSLVGLRHSCPVSDARRFAYRHERRRGLKEPQAGKQPGPEPNSILSMRG